MLITAEDVSTISNGYTQYSAIRLAGRMSHSCLHEGLAAAQVNRAL